MELLFRKIAEHTSINPTTGSECAYVKKEKNDFVCVKDPGFTSLNALTSLAIPGFVLLRKGANLEFFFTLIASSILFAMHLEKLGFPEEERITVSEREFEAYNKINDQAISCYTNTEKISESIKNFSELSEHTAAQMVPPPPVAAASLFLGNISNSTIYSDY